MNKKYDYIIIGAGSAGCVLAARLSEDPTVNVCLIEAGGKDSSALVQMPAGLAVSVPYGVNSWHYQTTPQAQLNNRCGFVPRGKVLGGSSSINAMVYIRGNRWDYDHWAAQGNDGWNYESLLPYFIKAENNHAIVSDYHGNSGPLHVNELQCPSPINNLFLDGCVEQGIAINQDINGEEQEGARLSQVTQHNGERCSAAKAYLTPNLTRPNLTVLTHVQVQRLVIENGHVDGVIIKHKKDISVLSATKEVLLSAGAINSPQLLMLSGIGDESALQKAHVPLNIHLPGVGKNLQDHLTVVPLYRAKTSAGTFGISVSGGANILSQSYQWFRYRRGKLTSNFAESHAFVSINKDSPAPDIQMEFVIGLVDDHSRKLHWGHGYSVHASLMRPKSRGTITLRDNNPNSAPLIDPNYLDHPDDLNTLLAGLKKTLSVLESSSFDSIKGQMIYPLDRHSDQQLIEFIRQTADTEYHPVGTCKMGDVNDKYSVVDNRLKVYGVDNLRIVDASIMPTIITGNTNAGVIAIAEKAADMIKLGH
ncbi:MAG: glucose-methanol-choline oxidoreductase [Gammaproteobacteria bacterium MedPE]|nr:MAG: glucose-methanol-choline oxidoreductase [Gammaproteobacteria bacterium MedPE]